MSQAVLSLSWAAGAQVLRACRDMAQRVFLEQIRVRADKLARNPPPPPKDLSVPPQVSSRSSYRW